MEYFGFMVCEIDGTVDNLHVNFDYKPQTERSGFFYAKWFKNEKSGRRREWKT